MEYIGEGDVNCLIGCNSINGQDKQMKLIANDTLLDTTEILSSGF